jgi:mono/diheme cytochrome c family protein
MIKFLLGIIVGACLILLAGYAFVASGGVQMSTDATSLPMEQLLAHRALAASIGKAGKEESPVPADESNLLAGAHIYQNNCAGCHGRIDDPKSGMGKNVYPMVPHLMPPSKGVTDDEVGETHWVVKHGIRFSAMPTYNARLSDTEIWQVSQLLHNADKLPPTVQEMLRQSPQQRARKSESPPPTAASPSPVATPASEPSTPSASPGS